MPTNQIKPFAVSSGANVTAQAGYEALSALSTGFQDGVAQADQVNKVLRQATFVASAVAQFASTNSGLDILDDGDVAGLAGKLLQAIQAVSGTNGPFVRQGSGIGQLSNTLKLGWSAASKLKLTVDVTDLGNVALETWVTAVLAGYQTTTNSLSTIATFNSSSSFTVPAGVTKVRVQVWGAGGSGGGSTNQAYPGGGGGAGGYGTGVYPVTPGQVIPVTVGIGGAAAAGGSSSFGTLLTANGGAVGTSGANGTVGLGGLGGTVAGQQYGFTGGAGSSGIIYSGSTGIEGGTGAGGFGSTIVRAVGTNGTQFSANPGLRPGGGSTGCTFSTAAGGAGLVIVEY